MQGETFDETGEGNEAALQPAGLGEADAQARAEASMPEVRMAPEDVAQGEQQVPAPGAFSTEHAGDYPDDYRGADTQPPAAHPYQPQQPYRAFASPPPAPPSHTSSAPGRAMTPPPPLPGQRGGTPLPPGPPERPGNAHGIPWYAWAIGAVLGAVLLAVVGCCALSGLAVGLFGQLRGGPEQTETTTKTFPVSGAPALSLHDPAGNITVSPGSGDSVVIQATKRVRGPFANDAQAELKAIQVEMMQNGNTVSVTVRLPNSGGFGNRSVDLDITAPPTTNLTTDANAGNVTLGAITGQLAITANAGNVDASGVTVTGASRISANAGNVTLDGALADATTLAVKVNAGNVTLRLPANTPAHLSARASVGNVTVTGWPIPVNRVNVTGASASGDLGPNPTGTITVAVESGNATIEAH